MGRIYCTEAAPFVASRNYFLYYRANFCTVGRKTLLRSITFDKSEGVLLQNKLVKHFWKENLLYGSVGEDLVKSEAAPFVGFPQLLSVLQGKFLYCGKEVGGWDKFGVLRKNK